MTENKKYNYKAIFLYKENNIMFLRKKVLFLMGLCSLSVHSSFLDEDNPSLSLIQTLTGQHHKTQSPETFNEDGTTIVYDPVHGLVYNQQTQEKTIYFDFQADCFFWQKKNQWYIQVPYFFGYKDELCTDKLDLSRKLKMIFENRVTAYGMNSNRVIQKGENFILQKRQGFFRRTEVTFNNVYDIHKYLLENDSFYKDYLYENKTFSHTGLILTTMLLGASLHDTYSRLSPLKEASEFYNDSVSTNIKHAGEKNLVDPLALVGLSLTLPKFVPLYVMHTLIQYHKVSGSHLLAHSSIEPESCIQIMDTHLYADSPQQSIELSQACHGALDTCQNVIEQTRSGINQNIELSEPCAFLTGLCFYTGRYGFNRSNQKAYYWFLKAASTNINRHATYYYLGNLAFTHAEAREFYERAEEIKYKENNCHDSLSYIRSSHNVAGKSYERILYAMVSFELGHLYEHGLGGYQNYNAARHKFIEAERDGHPHAAGYEMLLNVY